MNGIQRVPNFLNPETFQEIVLLSERKPVVDRKAIGNYKDCYFEIIYFLWELLTGFYLIGSLAAGVVSLVAIHIGIVSSPVFENLRVCAGRKCVVHGLPNK